MPQGIEMESFVYDIYNYAQLIPAIKEVISDAYAENDIVMKSKWDELQPLIADFCKKTVLDGNQIGRQIFNKIAIACKALNTRPMNYNLFADSLSDCLNDFYEAISYLGHVDVTEGEYRLFSSKSGFFSLENIETHRMYHSKTDPMWEAHEKAAKIYDIDALTYVFLGCDLGYLPWQVFSLSDSSANIIIYHNSKQILDYALRYGVLSWIPEEKLTLHLISDEFELLNSFSSENATTNAYHFCYDVLDSLSLEMKNAVYDFQSLNITKYNFAKFNGINVRRNMHNVNKTLHIFKPKTYSEEMIVVTAGPSLDSHLDYIKSRQGQNTIICASTVLKKLLSYEIYPDCVTVLDPQERTYGHFSDLPTDSTPLLLSVTSNWRFSEWYSGEKYLVPSMANAFSRKIFEEQGIETLFLGSTVSTMAISIAVFLGAKRVNIFGLDLAYPGGKSHASGTMDHTIKSTEGMIDVPCVNGGTVPTTSQFMLYIKEASSFFKTHPDVTFVNYSDIGAKFEGAIWHKSIDLI